MTITLMETVKVEKPWGNFEQYVLNKECTVKIITVNKGKRLSKQKHKHRSEFWVALDEGLIAEVDNEIFKLKSGDKINIPVGSTHRLSSTNDNARILEISFGKFDENDIERIEDDYGRK